VLFQGSHLTPTRWVRPEKSVAQSQRANRQAPRALQSTISKVDQLQAATTHVQDNAVLDRYSVYSAEEAEMRFLLAIGNINRDGQLLTSALDERFAIGGLADGRRGYGSRSFRASAHRHREEPVQDAQGALDRRDAELTIPGDVTHQAQWAARVGDHVEMSWPAESSDQDTATVRPDVDNAQDPSRGARLPIHV
jgi:hypothetical protein